jgi:hypothetical protein
LLHVLVIHVYIIVTCIAENILNYEIWFIEYITSHLNSFNMKKTKIYGVRNPGPGLWQAQTCGELKPILLSILKVVIEII